MSYASSILEVSAAFGEKLNLSYRDLFFAIRILSYSRKGNVIILKFLGKLSCIGINLTLKQN